MTGPVTCRNGMSLHTGNIYSFKPDIKKMEFKSLTNIESSFKRIRLMLAVFACCCALVTGYALWSSYRFAEKQREKIYVLDGGKSLMMALSQDLSQNRPAEAREHVRRFHELFFSLSPRMMPSSTISTVPCNWQTRVPITTMWILPKEGITTA